MQIIFDALVPVFAIVLAGYITGLSKILDKSSGRVLNEFVYYIALPALFFRAVASAPLEQLLNWQFIGANLFGILATFVVAVILGKLLFKSKLPTLAIQGMTASFCNTGYMGVPLTIAAFGEIASLPAALATLIHNIPIITFIVLVFETLRSKEKNLLYLVTHVSRTVLVSPIVFAVSLGLVFAIANVALAPSIDVFTKLLADTAGPCALFALGFGLFQSNIVETQTIDNQQIIILVILKLLFQPLVTMALVKYIFVIEPLWSDVTILFSALPIGVTAYVFAQRYNIYAEHVSRAILISTIISVVSLMACLKMITN